MILKENNIAMKLTKEKKRKNPVEASSSFSDFLL